ncbi:MAG TPA: AAA family ATPase [Fibrobacteria bacterium]|nr:AAA family ATPase [Fibrobacteria bacterium]
MEYRAEQNRTGQDREQNGFLYPFTALVGQERLRTALLLNLVNPSLGGVLIRGERGTGKSTSVRSLAQVAPSEPATGGPAPSGLRVVELPVSATEDRVVGGMDLEKALQAGERQFQPGILAQAHGQILYVDEINLLDDQLVDILLDVSAMGVNYVEREGVSHSHPSRFILVGTMNPEEGELRPQLSDRFALAVEVKGEHERENRIEILKRRLAFEENPEAFCRHYQSEEANLTARIQKARDFLPRVKNNGTFLEMAAELSIHMKSDGHRADIALVKTGLALAALDSRPEPGIDHLARAAEMVFPHRLTGSPFTEVSRLAGALRQWLDKKA